MQMGFRFAAFFAFALIAGCAGGKPVARDAAVVTVSAYGPDLFGKHEHGVGGRLEVREGVASQLSYPPMDVRSCNQSNTSCSLGIGVVDGNAEIISASATGATVAVNLNYRVSRSYSADSNGQRFKLEIPSDVQALQANHVISKTINVAYGEIVHLPLPFGVDVAVCAQNQIAGKIIPDRNVCSIY